jgi:hypothetical protein
MTVMRAAPAIRILTIAAAIAVGGCKRGPSEAELNRLDNSLMANDTDPALTSALQDQIMVDPALTQQSNKNAVRAPASPPAAQYPLPGGPQSGGQAGAKPGAKPPQTANADEPAERGADCGARLNYNPGWAQKLPAAFAVYPGARVTDAAGLDAADCRVRVVTFTTAAPPERVLDYYRARATGAGYSAEHQMREGDHILAGTMGQSDRAFYLILSPLKGGGSDVSLITNGG